MDFHADSLGRLMEIIVNNGSAVYEIFDQFSKDEKVSSLLLLFGLHPHLLEQRVRNALEKVRPYLDSHGGNVELLGIDEGVVHLQLQGSCKTCPSSTQTL